MQCAKTRLYFRPASQMAKVVTAAITPSRSEDC